MTIFQVFFGFLARFQLVFDFFGGMLTLGPRAPGNPFSDFFRSFPRRRLLTPVDGQRYPKQGPGDRGCSRQSRSQPMGGRLSFLDLVDVSAPKKIFSPPPPPKNSPIRRRHPPGPSPPWKTPPLVGFSIKTGPPPPPWPIRLPLPPPRPEKKIENIRNVHQVQEVFQLVRGFFETLGRIARDDLP